MSNELKWGIVLGVIVAVAAALYFFHGGGVKEDEQVIVDEPTKSAPQNVSDDDEPSVTEFESSVVKEPEPKPVKPEVKPIKEPVVVEAPAPSPEPLALAPEPTPEQKQIPIVEVKEAPKPVSQEPRYYIVKKGDTLTQISEIYYGEGRFWKVIYEANKNIINNPNVLNEGWKLRIPYPNEAAGKLQ
ncbi:MAG: LysM peptidoglycan-binding domain-containing protein [Sedimentisphaerales bacterium]|nr:LysM peptidoglycan-binding domain-containing protein [Sedimentisphaerales bacterium]